MPKIVTKPPVPQTKKRPSLVEAEIIEALQMLDQGKGAKSDGWLVLQLESTKSIATARAALSKGRASFPNNHPFKARGAVRLYEVERVVYVAVKV